MNTDTLRSKNNRILIIDDNPSIHDDIRKILGGEHESHKALTDAKALFFGDDSPTPEQERFDVNSAFQGQEEQSKCQSSLLTLWCWFWCSKLDT